MRLLLLTVDFAPARGGVQNLIARLAEGLAVENDVTVVAPCVAGDEVFDRSQRYRVVRTRPVGGKTAPLGIAIAAFVLIAQRRPDVIVCGHVLLGPLCRLVRAVLGIPYVAMAYAYEIRAPRMRAIAGMCLRGAARVITISEFSRTAVEAHGVRRSDIAVIRPGAATETNGPLSGGSADEPATILSVGRLVDAYKGQDMVIRAMPLVLSSVPTARYVIVGDGPLRGYLERLARSVGVAAAVSFVGQVSDDMLDEWYRRCTVFVLASRESAASGGAEGYGIVFIEAGLRGKPVVGGRSGGIPDAVLDGQTGILVNPLDLADIADAIVKILTNRPYAERLGREGFRRASEDLSWPRYTEAFRRTLETVR